MIWAGKQHPLEAAVERLAPIPLAMAVGWASSQLGFALVQSLALGAAALAAGFASIKIIGGDQAVAVHRFQPTDFEPVEAEELILEETDTILELDDRLEEPEPDSRVVRLFEREERTPGELVDRIVDYLSENRGQATARQRSEEAGKLPDASAALHEALANIRASLR